MITAAARSDWGMNAEEVPMDNELLCNKDFIRCSTLVAELLMKYKSMEIKEIETNGEPAEGSPLSFFVHFLLQILLSSYIIDFVDDYF